MEEAVFSASSFFMMKKILAILVLLSFVFISCHQEQKNIEQVAYAYLDALANYKVEEAKPYATSETCKTTLAISEQLLAMVDTAYIISDTPAIIDIQEIIVENDTMAVVKYVKNTPLKHDMKGELRLVKRERQWWAHDLLSKS